MIIEVYTGRTQDRPKWVNLISMVKENDKIVFDSVSRMSRTSDEGFADYKALYQRGITLEFINEPQIDTAVYRESLQIDIPMTGTDADLILKGVEQYLMKLAEKQIKIAFDQARKEVDDLRQRTIEGLQTARLAGKNSVVHMDAVLQKRNGRQKISSSSGTDSLAEIYVRLTV